MIRDRLDNTDASVLAAPPTYRVTFLHVRSGVKYEEHVGAWNQYRARTAGETALGEHLTTTAGHLADWAWYSTADVLTPP